MQEDLKKILPKFSKKTKWQMHCTSLGNYKGQRTAENKAKDHTNTGLIIMWRIFSDIITISFSLHIK